MPTTPKNHFEVDVTTFTIGPELGLHLGHLMATARTDLKPRNFPERHLVDELAISKWRAIRVSLMEKAVFEHESVTFKPRALKDESGDLFEPHEDMYHLAMAHAPERHATVLAALGRLEIRYARQFATALRLLIALGRGTTPLVPATNAVASKPKLNGPNLKGPKLKGKETPCEPSPTAPPVI